MADPAPRDPEQTVSAVLDRLAPPAPVGIAVSGGSDSTALLLIAADWASRRKITIRAATVDHGLRPESGDEALTVARLCDGLDVPHDTLSVCVAESGGNLQAQARAARYDGLARWARDHGLASVLLGHTLDDQAETLLMRLARGSGVEGLSAIQEAREWAGVRWLRPMLEERRAGLRAWLAARDVGWIDDPTNEDPGFDRIRARRALETLEPVGITPEGLAATAQRLARQRRVLEAAMADLAAQALRPGRFGEARLARAPLHTVPRDTALRLFAETLRQIGASAYRPRFRAVDEHFRRALQATESTSATLAGCLIRPEPDRDTILICREPAAVAPPAEITARKMIWDGRWEIETPPEAAGSTVGALGPDGRRHLRHAAAEGDWAPPGDWAAAPAVVQETVPTIRAKVENGSDCIVAVPSVSYVSKERKWAGTVRIAPVAVIPVTGGAKCRRV